MLSVPGRRRIAETIREAEARRRMTAFSHRIAALAVASVLLASCAERPHGVLTPTGAQAPGTSRVDMLIATTRDSEGAQPGELFTGERGEGLAFADIAISLPPDSMRKIGDVQWPESSPPDPLRDFVTLRADRLDRAAALARFDARVAKAPRRQVLVFVHGFNTRFEEAVYRFAQIVHDAGSTALPVLFTWPSRGKLLAYGYDHESASYSRDALEVVLQSLARDKSVGEISILAHSMGNWVTIEALRQMAIRNHGLPAKITSVMLAAPDVDFDVFRRQIAQIGSASARFTIFVSRDDDALAASRHVWGDRPRLGAIDPEIAPYKQDLHADRILVEDLTGVSSDDPLNHGTFAQAPEVVRLIGKRLAGGQALTDGGSGVGDKFGQIAVGAAGAVGSAAGVAISAPFAVVDPRTRQNLGENFEQMGSNLGDMVGAGGAALGGR
jgi:esterase/lipase superfamily enzyme